MTAAQPGHNGGPPLDEVDPSADLFTQIQDLFDEAVNFCDGDPIESEEMAAVITELYDGLHALGKKADELRVAEKKPLDDQIAAIQLKFNKFIQPKKGLVDVGKSELGKILGVWRAAVAAKKEAAAAAKRAEAAAAALAAQEAIRASSGNLSARVEAEEQLAHAKSLEKVAARAERSATTGTGLRTVWTATPLTEDGSEEKRLDWAFSKDPRRFTDMVQEMASEAARAGVREIPGFRVWDDKVAAAGRAA